LLLIGEREPGVCSASRPVPASGPGNGGQMDFKLERTDGTPAEPATYRTGVYAWRPGDTIPLGATRTLRVVEVRRDDREAPAVLIVEDVA
jgi:hypothetical protein